MPINPLTIFDDWLIDSVFQPISDWIRLNFGWSSDQIAAPLNVVMGLFFGIAANRGITIASQNLPFIATGTLKAIVFILCLIAFYRGWLLTTGKFPGKGSGNFLNARRTTERVSRIGYMIITLGFIVVLARDLYLTPDENQTMLLLMIGSMLSGVCSYYFEACTDLPQPPKKVVLQSL